MIGVAVMVGTGVCVESGANVGVEVGVAICGVSVGATVWVG